jgi:coenzyme F420-0:L-glutamate ligase/coenzyme F420-1:gamma-L-glutamate ligase
VRQGDDVGALIATALDGADLRLQDRDVVVVTSKILSKVSGRLVRDDPVPGAEARRLAGVTGFPPGQVELILSESRAVLRSAPGVLVTETREGFVCANAGVDRSNTGLAGAALLLPTDPDGWARRIRAGLEAALGVRLAVLVSDTFGRPFRHGLVNVALGVSGISAIRDHRGQADADGHVLQGTEIAVADELCGAAELVMGKLDRVPVAVVRGYRFEPGEGSGRQLLRDPAQDLFR